MSASSGWLSKVLRTPTLDRTVTQRVAQALIIISGALLVWWFSLPAIDTKNIGDLGLITALPIAFFVALALLIVGFCLALHERRPSAALLTVYTVALTVVLRATPALIFDEARYSWTYKHIGLANYVRLHGGVNPLIDAYHNWPGFFAVSALFTEAAAFASPAQYAPWAQLFFNLLYIGPLVLIFRAFTRDTRLVWTGVWLFAFANWVGQDYFAPQAHAFLLFLVIVTILVTSLRGRQRAPAHDEAGSQDAPLEAGSATVKRQLAFTLLLLTLFAGIAPSHQLTPFMLISGVSALILFNQLKVRTLPIWLIIITFAWNFTFAKTFMTGHSDWYSNIGDLATNLKSAVNRPASPTVVGRSTVLMLTQMFTLFVWGLAFLGAMRQLRERRWTWAAVLLAAAPFPIILAQSYGGEIMLRIYLFSSPFMAFLAAALIFPSERVRSSVLTFALTLVVSATFLAGFLLAHFGNEKANVVTTHEVATSRYLYTELPQGSSLAFITHNFPEKIAGYYDQYQSYSLVRDYDLAKRIRAGFNPSHLAKYLRDKNAPAFVVFARGDQEYAESFGQLPPGAAGKVERAIHASSEFRLVYRTPDSRVYALNVPSQEVTR